MVSWSQADQNAYEARLRASNERLEVLEGCEKERDLHQEIIDYCNRQWPKWKFIHARMDCRSTIEEGAQDFTIFLPAGKVLCIECKSRTNKLEPKQLAWKLEMERLSHVVHTVRSMEQFLQIANHQTKGSYDRPAEDGIQKLRHVRD